MAILAKLAFGEKSERSKTTKASVVPTGGVAGSTQRRRGQQPGSCGHGRRDYSNLETEEEVHDVAEGERNCPECGAQYAPYSEETSEQIDWVVRVVRVTHRRPTYRKTCTCTVGGVLVAPVVPNPIRKGPFTSQFLAKVEGVDPLWCWAYIRRYFIRAGDAHKELGPWKAAWVERIGALYPARRALAATETGSAAHARAEADFAEALTAMDEARRNQEADETLHPRARRVLATLDNEWEGLVRHQEFPELPLDNNTAERELRGPVVGRKNYHGCGSVSSAEAAGRIWTATAMSAGFNPLSWLTTYLDACAGAGGRAPEGRALEHFLPWVASEDDLALWRDAPREPGP